MYIIYHSRSDLTLVARVLNYIKWAKVSPNNFLEYRVAGGKLKKQKQQQKSTNYKGGNTFV